MGLRESSIINFLKNLFIYFLAVLGLHCCGGFFSSCGEQGTYIAVTFLVSEHGLEGLPASVTGAPRLWSTGSVVVAHGFSCSVVCGIFSDQGLNPRLLHWQADSLPLGHQGSP